MLRLRTFGAGVGAAALALALLFPSVGLAWEVEQAGLSIRITRDASVDSSGTVNLYYRTTPLTGTNLQDGTWDNPTLYTNGGTILFDSNDARVDFDAASSDRKYWLVRTPDSDNFLIRLASTPVYLVSGRDGVSPLVCFEDEYGDDYLAVGQGDTTTQEDWVLRDWSMGSAASGVQTVSVESTLPVAVDSIAGMDYVGLSIFGGLGCVVLGLGVYDWFGRRRRNAVA